MRNIREMIWYKTISVLKYYDLPNHFELSGENTAIHLKRYKLKGGVEYKPFGRVSLY